MTDSIKDLSILTTIPKSVLDKLTTELQYVICHSIEESSLQSENITKIDIGIGTLLISVEDEGVRYKFIPSSSLEQTVKWTILNHKSPIIHQVEEALKDKVMNVYKELL